MKRSPADKAPSAPPHAPFSEVKEGMPVRTPSGHPAVITSVHAEVREATVLRLDDGEKVRFRYSKLVFLVLEE